MPILGMKPMHRNSRTVQMSVNNSLIRQQAKAIGWTSFEPCNISSQRAHGGSFNAAAREMNVSVPAISRLIGALEKSLGVVLLERSSLGLALTADGTKYLETCKPLVEQLIDADDAIRGSVDRPYGSVVIGAPPTIAQHCIMPALSEFQSRYPDLQVDLRTVDKPSAEYANEAEIMVLHGWPYLPDLVQRHLAYSRMLICASPDYWAQHGIPRNPAELARHQCLLFRDQDGTVMDFWEHQRQGVKQSVTVSGRLISDHRDALLDGAIAGMGVIRVADLSVRRPLRVGTLVPVLLDWESTQAPPVSLFYRSTQRRLLRLRLTIKFLIELFGKLESERPPDMTISVKPERPHWYRRRHGRASATPIMDETI